VTSTTVVLIEFVIKKL